MAQIGDQARSSPARVIDRFGARRAWERSLLCSNGTGGHRPQAGCDGHRHTRLVCARSAYCCGAMHTETRHHLAGADTVMTGSRPYLPGGSLLCGCHAFLRVRGAVCSDALSGVHCGAGCGCLLMRVARTCSPAPSPPAVALASYWCRANREQLSSQATDTVPFPVGPSRRSAVTTSTSPAEKVITTAHGPAEECADRARRRADAPVGDASRARAPGSCCGFEPPAGRALPTGTGDRDTR